MTSKLIVLIKIKHRDKVETCTTFFFEIKNLQETFETMAGDFKNGFANTSIDVSQNFVSKVKLMKKTMTVSQKIKKYITLSMMYCQVTLFCSPMFLRYHGKRG